MSIYTARNTLAVAFQEIESARDNPQRLRQIAEKGWRAAREAVYSVLSCYGEKPIRRTLPAAKIADFESRKGVAGLTDGYSRAISVLHGDCFYEGICPGVVEKELREVKGLVDRAEKAMNACKKRKQR